MTGQWPFIVELPIRNGWLHGSTMFHCKRLQKAKYPHLTMTSIYPIKSYHSFELRQVLSHWDSNIPARVVKTSTGTSDAHLDTWARWTLTGRICSPGLSSGHPTVLQDLRKFSTSWKCAMSKAQRPQWIRCTWNTSKRALGIGFLGNRVMI